MNKLFFNSRPIQHFSTLFIFIILLLTFGCKRNEVGQIIVKMPCINDSGSACKTIDSMSRTLVLRGDQDESYSVKIRIRGIVELRNYPEGESRSGFWQKGGKKGPLSDTSNIYKITISKPQKVYYLNAGKSISDRTFKIDTTITIKSNGESILTLTGLSVDGYQNHNQDQKGQPLEISSAHIKKRPFNGQYVQVDVLSQKGH